MANETVYGLIIFTLFVVASYIDSLHFYPYQIKAGRESQIQCHDYPEKCWIQIKHHDK